MNWQHLPTPHPIGFNDNMYHEGIISEYQILMGFIRKRNKRSHVKRKSRSLKCKNRYRFLILSNLSFALQ